MEAVIYSITTKDGLYIGSTIDFKNRCYKHKYSLKSGKLFLLYENIRKNNGEYKIEIILNLACEDKIELRKIEEEHRILCEANLNSWSAFNTEDEKLEKFINYRHSSKELRIKNNTEKVNCECGGKYTYCNKIQHYKTKKHQLYLSSL